MTANEPSVGEIPENGERGRYLAALSAIQQMLLGCEDVPRCYAAIVETLGRASGASRVYIFENHRATEDRLLTSRRAEWCAPGITPEISNPTLQCLCFADVIPRWAAALARGEEISGCVADFPESERALLEPQGILSILVLPLTVGGEFFGFLGFDNCTAARAWTPVEADLLRATAAAIALGHLRARAAVALGAAEAQSHRLYEHAQEGIFRTGFDDRIHMINPAGARILGYASPDELLTTLTSLRRLYVDSARQDEFARLMKTRGVVTNFEIQLHRRDGELIWLLMNARAIRDATGAIVATEGMILDITDRKRTEEALRLSEERFRTLVQTTSDIISVVDSGGIIRYLSPAAERILGYAPVDLIEADVFAYLHDEDVGLVGDALRQRTADPDRPPVPVEFRMRHRDGSWRFLEAMTTGRIQQPDLAGFVIDVRDITDRKRLEEELRYQAFHDPLTGLANRALFLDRLGHALASAERHGSLTAVLLLDLDHFKLVNDSYGHPIGDQLVVAVGQRLSDCVRPGDTVARFGGDEFTFVLEDVSGPADALAVAERILDALRAPFPLEGAEVYVTASIGIALSGGAAITPETLFRNADTALYQAKGSGRARAVLFEPAMSAAVVARQELGNDLRRAVARGELLLYYQPEVDLASGAIVGAEALVRWHHGERGLVAPKDFIPLAEETGVILAIGEWVLREACHRATAWQALGPDGAPLVVGVNISARQLAQPAFVWQVRQVLEESQLSAACLRLEITETVVMEDLEVALAALAALRTLGVQVALDDFGTGYSSLSYLRRLPVDVVKIDQSFIRELDHDGPTAAIVHAVVTLAHTLGMRVTAEGIETAGQLARTRILTCDAGQGYYFAEPLTGDALATLLSRTQTMSLSVLPPTIAPN